MQAFEDYRKVREVIKSCNNEDQLRVGVKMYNLLNKKYGQVIPAPYFEILENIIGLMRMKCESEKEKGINEISKVGEEFRIQAALTNEPELQKIRFTEDEVTGGKGDDMTAEDIADQYDIPIEDIKKEIYIGSQIEKEHTDNEELAKEFAIDHIVKFIEENDDYDYYTDPQYGIIAIEDKMGEEKKTVRISKSDMDKLHDEGIVDLDDIKITFKDEVTENLDFNSITNSLRDQLKKKHKKRFSKEEIFDKIREKRRSELQRRQDNEEIIDTDEEIEEATGSGSAGVYVGPMTGEVVKRVFKKDIPISVNGIVGKHKMTKPIGKMFSYDGVKNESEILEEEDIEEATSYNDAVGQYATPGFAPSEFMGTAGKKGKAPVNKGITHQKLAYPGGDFVKIKDRCARFPYCNQSPEAIKISKRPFKDAFYENKKIKKRNLKIKK